MTLDEFEIALADWGGEVDQWPSEARMQAASLLQSSADARDMLAEAQRFDVELDGLLGGAIAAPSGLADRIFTTATNPPYSAEIVRLPLAAAASVPVAPAAARKADWWPPRRSSMVAAAAMVVCFFGGMLTVQTVFPEASSSEAAYASSVNSSLDW